FWSGLLGSAGNWLLESGYRWPRRPAPLLEGYCENGDCPGKGIPSNSARPRTQYKPSRGRRAPVKLRDSIDSFTTIHLSPESQMLQSIPPSVPAHGQLHLFFYGMGQPLDLFGLANHSQRECVLTGLVHFRLEVAGQLQEFGAVVGNLALAFHVGRLKVRLLTLLLVHGHLGIGVGRAIGLRQQNGLLSVGDLLRIELVSGCDCGEDQDTGNGPSAEQRPLMSCGS